MGLTDLREILVRKEKNLEELEGKHAVDAFNALYQFLTSIRQPDGTPLMDSQGRITSHLSGLFYRTCSLLEKNILPVYVFDGEPSELKKRTIAERRERKKEAEEQRIKALKEGRVEEAGRLAQRTASLSKEMVDESKKLLEAMGVPFVQAPSEGEAQCAFMAQEKVVDSACSQDYDALLFGAPLLTRNLTIAGKRKLPFRNQFIEVSPEQIFLQENLDSLGITREKLVWIALFCGTDFNEGIYGIGPKKALKLVKESSSLEEALKKAKAEADWIDVLEFFLKPPTTKVEASNLVFREPDKQKLTEFMLSREFSQQRIENALARAFKEPVNSSQKGLGSWC